MAAITSFVFAAITSGLTLKHKYTTPKVVAGWGVGLVLDFCLVYLSYNINPFNDVMNALGQCAIVLLCLILLYEDPIENKIFIGVTMVLTSSVGNFLFCGTTDQIVGAKLDLFDEVYGPYTVKNILFFCSLKILVLLILGIAYTLFLRKIFREMLTLAGGQMKKYLFAPLFSLVGFYVINIVSNENGIYPTNKYFVPLYLTICAIFVVEYVQIVSSVKWTAEAKKAEQEKERIGAELNVATQIQADMLPSIFPAFPDRKELDIYATMDPAKEVGGDFYDFFFADDDHLALIIADVSGKGVPAALFMVIAKTLIKNLTQASESMSPAEILSDVNNSLCEGNEAGLFVTVWMAIIDIKTGKGKAVNAGHEHPAIRRKDGKYEMIKYPHLPALAIMEGIKYKDREFELNPGDSIFVYTDGVDEATNISEELFGEERTLKALNSDPAAAPDVLLGNVKKAIDEFVGDAPQFDDITMLGFTYFGI